MNGLLIFLLALNVAMLVVVTVFYRRAKKKQEARRVEGPNSDYKSQYVQDLEVKQRWEGMDRSLLHEVNLEEFDRVLSKLRATSVRALTDTERSFLDRMLEAERRVQKTLRRDRRVEEPVSRQGSAGESGAESRPGNGKGGNGGGTPRHAHGTS